MKQSALSIKMNKQVKEDFDNWCASVGMTSSTAVNLFVKAVLRERKLPFNIISDDPFFNEANQNFLKEGIKALNNGEGKKHELIDVDED